MIITSPHSFHIPVMGLAYTIDTPVKVARFGISSVISIIEDNLLEEMRHFYCRKEEENFTPIPQNEHDSRAKRITAYLNLVQKIVKNQIEKLKSEAFSRDSEIVKYFELLPDSSALKREYEIMKRLDQGDLKNSLQDSLKKRILPGSIDVNIMTKCDKINYSQTGEPLPAEYSDAMAALRGYAGSELNSSIVFSAGMNPRLYSYCESFADFYPDAEGVLKKKIILKVSDFRSALIQGKFLAKKGLWISEFRIESGLNCGGHAFATDGHLLAPILEDFKQQRRELTDELFTICNEAILKKGLAPFSILPDLKVSVQGGIGTANENNFLLNHYDIDSTGWGSPFLLVPEATNVDDETLMKLVTANKDDYYLSNSSPLGVPFNNFRKSSAETERVARINKGKPGSPCYNKYLSSNTEFTEKPICTASREYQELKINQLITGNLPQEVLTEQIQKVTEKECICQGLGTPVFLKNKIAPPHKLKAVSICPGPNLAYFSGVFSLADIVDHIYGRKNILNTPDRPHMFVNELKLYVRYLENEIGKNKTAFTEKLIKHFKTFKENLLSGIEYYKTLTDSMVHETDQYRERFKSDVAALEKYLRNINLPDIAT